MASESPKGSGWAQVILVTLGVLAVGIVLVWPYLGGKKAREVAATPAEVARHPGDAVRDALIRAAAESAQACVSGRWEVLESRARQAAEAGADRLWIYVWTLFTAFDALETQEQQGALRAFFETGRDVRFGDTFAIGPGGWLMDWPTLRVALFDYVAQRDPELARELAVLVLRDRPDEPGEWALAMRELARGRRAGEWGSLLAVRVREFVGDPVWAVQGAPGWTEGFDVLVAGLGPEYLRDLSEISATGTRAARFAAFQASDRLVMAAPAACLRALNDDPALYAQATGVRAGLFARCDVRDTAQRAELERYFARPDVGPGERAQFAAAFPHVSAAPTHRLLSVSVARTPAETAAMEAATLEHVRGWCAAGEFSEWAGVLEEVRVRLEARVVGAAGEKAES